MNANATAAVRDFGSLNLEFFCYLQLLDFLTTILGFRVGAGEASPFIRGLMHLDPVIGVALSKVIALVLGGICIWLNKTYLIKCINYWYAALVIWNMVIIFRAVGFAL